MPDPKLNMKDLLRTASTNKKVAMAIMKNPEQFADLYNLSAKQVAGLKDIGTKFGRGIGKDIAAAGFEYE